MLKNIIKLEHTVEGKVGQFLCENDTQIPHVKEMLLAFLKYVGNLEDQIKAQQDKAKADAEAASPAEEVIPVPGKPLD